MYRLFTALSLLRFFEYVLITILSSYSKILKMLEPLIATLLISAIVLALIAIISRFFTTTGSIVLIIAVILIVLDAYITSQIIMHGIYFTILSMYVASLINILIDCVLFLIGVELLRT